MTTDLLAEDRGIVEFGVVHGRPSTSTEDIERVETLGTFADADMWWHLDCAPPRYSVPGMAVYEFAKNLWQIANVVAVSHGVDRGVQLVWTVLATRDKDIRRRIYEYERALMAAYPDLVFNFHVTALDQGAGVSFMRDVDARVVLLRSFGQ